MLNWVSLLILKFHFSANSRACKDPQNFFNVISQLLIRSLQKKKRAEKMAQTLTHEDLCVPRTHINSQTQCRVSVITELGRWIPGGCWASSRLVRVPVSKHMVADSWEITYVHLWKRKYINQSHRYQHSEGNSKGRWERMLHQRAEFYWDLPKTRRGSRESSSSAFPLPLTWTLYRKWHLSKHCSNASHWLKVTSLPTHVPFPFKGPTQHPTLL